MTMAGNAGAFGTTLQRWVGVPLTELCLPGMRRWLLIRRTLDDPDELAYFLAYGPEATTPEELVRIGRLRWVIEECFAQAKGEVGLDQYEVRTWEAWHRFVTLCLLAHAALVVVRGQAVGNDIDANKGVAHLALSP